MRRRVGSAESVVFPVPESPKNSATSPSGAHVRRAVHGENIPLGQNVVEDGEDGFLHLARIARAGDEHDFALEVDDDGVFGVRSVLSGVRMEARNEEQRELGHVVFRLLRVRPDEQLPREQTMPGALRDHANRHGVFRVRAREAVVDEQILALKERQQLRVEPGELLCRHRLVHRSPIHDGFGHLVAHNELVFWRTAGELPRPDDVRAAGRKQAFMPMYRSFKQLRRPQIPVSDVNVFEAVFVQAIPARPDSRILHGG